MNKIKQFWIHNSIVGISHNTGALSKQTLLNMSILSGQQNSAIKSDLGDYTIDSGMSILALIRVDT